MDVFVFDVPCGVIHMRSLFGLLVVACTISISLKSVSTTCLFVSPALSSWRPRFAGTPDARVTKCLGSSFGTPLGVWNHYGVIL